MEAGDNYSEVNSEAMYSARDLAEMRLPGLPDTERAWLDRAKKGKWDFKEVSGRGRGGIKRIYTPPLEIRALIEARKRGEAPSAQPHAVRELEPYNTQVPDGFVLVPRYDVAGSMGNGTVIHSEQIVDHLAFRAEWVRTELGTSPANLVLISAVGDSMEPTLRAHDLLLIDRSVQSVKQDSIYAFAVEGELRVKRIQRLVDGTLIVKSDNPGYDDETLPSDQAGLINIVGRVVWSGRRM